MANNTRIYVVREQRDDGERVALVDAATAAQAIGHVVRGQFTAKVAEQVELVEHVGKGVKVQKAGAES